MNHRRLGMVYIFILLFWPCRTWLDERHLCIPVFVLVHQLYYDNLACTICMQFLWVFFSEENGPCHKRILYMYVP